MLCVDGACEPCSRATVPDAACTEAFPDLPYCDPRLGTCVPCTTQTKCPDGTPVCDPQVGCVACTEHAHCPDSACHLGGPDEGRCFDVADVVDVESPAIEAECDGLTWIDNAVNEPGFGMQVGDYDSSWFSPSITSPFLLSSEGESIFEGIATWELGDPTRDVEGDARPQDGLGFPGVDEP